MVGVTHISIVRVSGLIIGKVGEVYLSRGNRAALDPFRQGWRPERAWMKGAGVMRVDQALGQDGRPLHQAGAFLANRLEEELSLQEPLPTQKAAVWGMASRTPRPKWRGHRLCHCALFVGIPSRHLALAL